MNVIESTVHIVQQTLTMCSHLDMDNHNILVIGTTAAHKHRIYPKALESLGLKVLAVEDAEQRVIQQGIDHIKEGNLEKGGQVIVDAVRSKIENSTHVIMGCSEITLAVKREHVHRVKDDVMFIDTTELMAQSVAAWLVMQNQRYKWVQNSFCGG